MRKTLHTIVILLALAGMANAQGPKNDNFFVNMEYGGNGLDKPEEPMNPVVPGGHNITGDIPGAPLGSGLLVLTALGGAYALKKRRS